MYRISCIAYHVLHIMYCISCIAYHVSHILYRISYMQGHGRPRGTRSHERPREATGGHGKDGRPRAAPHRPPQNIIPTKMGRPRSPERSVKKKTGDGGQRGATGGNGAAAKKSRNTNRPLQYPRGPLQAAPVWGIYLSRMFSFSLSLSIYILFVMRGALLIN